MNYIKDVNNRLLLAFGVLVVFAMSLPTISVADLVLCLISSTGVAYLLHTPTWHPTSQRN